MAISDLCASGAPTVSKGPACTVCQLLNELSDTEATALRNLLADPLWRYSALSEALKAEGYNVAAFTLARHARGQCSAGVKCR